VSTNEERRKCPRVPAEHLVSYTHYDEEGDPDDMGMARTLDLSEGGILLEMTRPARPGSALEIKMVSGEHIIRARGQVAYSQLLSPDRWRVGVSFVEITQGDLVTIEREVAEAEDVGGRAECSNGL
jgi:hypothetical protein